MRGRWLSLTKTFEPVFFHWRQHLPWRKRCQTIVRKGHIRSRQVIVPCFTNLNQGCEGLLVPIRTNDNASSEFSFLQLPQLKTGMVACLFVSSGVLGTSHEQPPEHRSTPSQRAIKLLQMKRGSERFPEGSSTGEPSAIHANAPHHRWCRIHWRTYLSLIHI